MTKGFTTHIDRLRNLSEDSKVVVNAGQVRILVDDIYDAVSAQDTLAREEMSGLTIDDLCTVAERFGKFRAQSKKGSPKANTLLLEDIGMLFAPSREEVLKRAKTRKSFGKTTNGWNKKTPVPHDELVGEVPAVIVPQGYDPAETGRSIRACLAALAIDRPEDSEIERFVARHYTDGIAELTADHVHLTWWLAYNKLGGLLDKLGGSDVHVAKLIVESYDLLNTHRQIAVEALAGFEKANVDDLVQLRELHDDLSWTNPGLFANLSQMLDMVENNPDSPRLKIMLQTRLNTVASWAKDASRTILSDVDHLTEGHCHMIVTRAGLVRDISEERAVREHLRTYLHEIGMGSDLDREIPAGLAAWRMGMLPDYLASRKARAEGDPEWESLFSAENVEDEELIVTD